MIDRPWLANYPPGVPADIDPSQYHSLVALMQQTFTQYAQRVAYRFMGQSVTYAEVDNASGALAAWLQGLGLAKGERVALMMPNCPQYPIAVAAVLRAGLVVVNVNPLYTPRELEHQLRDSSAKAIVIMENFASTLQRCITRTAVKHVLLTGLGDCLGTLKGWAVNFVVRHIKRLVRPFDLPAAARWKRALAAGAARPLAPVEIGPDDLALLQYTGGTTGVAKGAMLLHRNVLANVLQSEAWYLPAMEQVSPDQQPTIVCALPLYHIFAFTVCMMLCLRTGGKSILIANPRDLKATLKDLAGETFHSFPAVNTLFAGIVHHPDFDTVNWRNLRVSVGGGMAVQSGVAKLWLEKTGCPICEGYGLSETSPTVTCNPIASKEYNGSIGLPLPSTYVKLVDDQGRDAAPGQAGEIAIKGPQVMAGYWQCPDETAASMTEDGYLRTGDIGTVDERGYFRIIDRKKDTILVSGFNVYPNEVEDVVSQLPGVLECAVVGVPDDRAGEAVKLFVIKKDPALTAEQIQRHCHKNLTGYKRPKFIEFRTDLPKSPVGKILRRQLRDE